MNRGNVLGIEAFLIFLAWLLVLSVIWSNASFSAHAQFNSWKTARAFETALSSSDALLRNHSTNPWSGCAVYDFSTRRVRVHEVSDTCLRSLSAHPPSSPFITLVSRFSLHSTSFIYFSSPVSDENSFCVTLRRPARDSLSHEVFFLEVRSCVA